MCNRAGATPAGPVPHLECRLCCAELLACVLQAGVGALQGLVEARDVAVLGAHHLQGGTERRTGVRPARSSCSAGHHQLSQHSQQTDCLSQNHQCKVPLKRSTRPGIRSQHSGTLCWTCRQAQSLLVEGPHLCLCPVPGWPCVHGACPPYAHPQPGSLTTTPDKPDYNPGRSTSKHGRARAPHVPPAPG